MAKDLDSLILEGSKKYALRDFEAATEIFAKACEEYSETHDTDSPALLFLYGRSLFQVGVSKSDVLGSGNDNKEKNDEEEADEEDEAKEKKPETTKSADEKPKSKFQFAEDDITKNTEKEDGGEPQKQQTGEEAEAEEEQSDLEAAWEILDTSRALFLTEIEKQNNLLKKSDTQAIKDKIEELQKGLAETYDVLGEVSLESENFEQAVLDLKESLQLKKKLYAPTSSLISEAHFKLSLAYEYCVDDPEHPASKPHESSTTDTALENKKRAVEEMEAAIAIVTAREKAGENKDATLLHDLELRLNDLKNSIKHGEETDKQKEDVIKGLTGSSTASSAAQEVAATLVKQSIAQAISGATDLSGLVRKGKKKKDSAGNKRKLEEDAASQGSNTKKMSR